jgi:hypothetical protein
MLHFSDTQQSLPTESELDAGTTNAHPDDTIRCATDATIRALFHSTAYLCRFYLEWQVSRRNRDHRM